MYLNNEGDANGNEVKIKKLEKRILALQKQL